MLLHPSKRNPRFFENGNHKIVYLQGAYIGQEFQDYMFGYPKTSDFDIALSVLKNNNANLLRMWTGETTGATGSVTLTSPMPWQRSGTCCSFDGQNKFDLGRLDVGDLSHPSIDSPHYFERMRARVMEARRNGVYVSVMLFHSFGWENSLRIPGLDIWDWHPFNALNNVNGVDPDTNHDGQGLELGSVGNSWQPYQDAYIREVVRAVGDLDNVMYEVCNECWDTTATNTWQNSVIRKIHSDESTFGFARHPVGMTSLQDYNNEVLTNSEADFVSSGGATLEANPPLAAGRKVEILDMDHILPCSNNNSPSWPWKAFTRGDNLWYIYCGPTGDGISYGNPSTTEQTVMTRMGLVRALAGQVDLASMRPTGDAAQCSTTYCLRGNREVLAYLPNGGAVSVDVPRAGRYKVVWIDGSTGAQTSTGHVSVWSRHGATVQLTSPLGTADAAVLLSRS